jgi:putative sigma-54 modulation protein
MNTNIQAVNFTLRDESRQYLEKKLGRIHNAESMIVDMLIKLGHDKDFSAEATVNFKWGASAHVKETDFVLNAAIDKMMDTLEAKVDKEKDKIKDTNRG